MIGGVYSFWKLSHLPPEWLSARAVWRNDADAHDELLSRYKSSTKLADLRLATFSEQADDS